MGAESVLRAAAEVACEALLSHRGPWSGERTVAMQDVFTAAVDPVREALSAAAADDPHGAVGQLLAAVRRMWLHLGEGDLDGARIAAITARTLGFRLAGEAELGPDVEDPHRWRF